MLCTRRGMAVNPLAAHRVLPAQPLAGPITVPSAAKHLAAAVSASAPPPVCRYILDFLLRFHMWCLAKLLDFSAWLDAKRQSPVARSCQHHSQTKGPFLHRHYPASSVLRPYPPPQEAGSVPHDTTVGQRRLPAAPRGFPCCTQPLFRTCRRHYPRRNRWVPASFAFPNGGGLPRNSDGSASALPFSRPAQRSLHVTACALAKSLRTLYTRSFDRFVTSTAVPIATGWNDNCRVGFAPTKVVHLCTAH